MIEHIHKTHNLSLLIYDLACPAKFLWGGNIWKMGYYINTVGKYGDVVMLKNYVKNQGIAKYEQLHSKQVTLF